MACSHAVATVKNSVILDGDDEAIFVAERNSMHALNGDKVKVLVAAHRKGVEPECKVIEILSLTSRYLSVH